jgi:hypothetical protein
MKTLPPDKFRSGNSGQSPRQGRKLEILWRFMRTTETFTAPRAAAAAGASPRFTRAYISALAAAGYLDRLSCRLDHRSYSSSSPQRYTVNAAAKSLTIAPQLSGGKTGNARLGNRWASLRPELPLDAPQAGRAARKKSGART